MENSVREFASEQPGADYAAIVKWFGPPERIAESYVAEMDSAELIWGMKIRYKVLLIVAATAALCAVMRFCMLATAYTKYAKNMNGYAVVEVIEIESETFTEGDTLK